MLELHTKKIVGYNFDFKMTTELVLEAMKNALHAHNPTPWLIVHADLGTQYKSEASQEN